MNCNQDELSERDLDQTKEHIIEYPIPEQIHRQLSAQSERVAEMEPANISESRSVYQKRKREEEKQAKRKRRNTRLAFAGVFVILMGVLCGTAIATTMHTPHNTVEIASANAQYVKHTVIDAAALLTNQLTWKQEEGSNEPVTKENSVSSVEIDTNTDNTEDNMPNQEDNQEETQEENQEEVTDDTADTPTVPDSSVVTSDNARGIDPSKPMIALTFDDGPSQYTWSIVETLYQHNGRGTFFLVGDRIASHKAAIEFTIANGNEIASHGFSHANLVKLSDEDVLLQIQNVDDLLQQQHDYTATLFRVPYGEHDDRVLDILQEQGKPVIGWSVDPRDWEVRDKDEIVTHVLKYVRDGDIILMHDIYQSTADAVAELVPALQERGYQLVTVSELFQYKGKTLQPGTYYRSVTK